MRLRRSMLEQNRSRVKIVVSPGHLPPTAMFQRKKKATHTNTRTHTHARTKTKTTYTETDEDHEVPVLKGY